MMKRTIFASCATAAILTCGAVGPAKAEITTLGDCINAVISWCSDTYGDEVDCSQSSGIEACKEVFGNEASVGKSYRMTLPGRGVIRLVVPGVERARSAGGDRDAPLRRDAATTRPPRADSEIARGIDRTARANTTLRPREMRIPIPSPIPRSPIPSPRP